MRPSSLCLLVLLMVNLTGCVMPQSPNPAKQAQALSLIDQGTIALRAGELDRAEATFQAAWEIDELPAAVDGLGCVAFLRGDSKRAEELFIQAYQMDDDYTEALGNLALLYEANGLSENARQLFERAIAENPGNARVRNNFAAYLKERAREDGDSERSAQTSARARQELFKAHALSPHPLIEQNLEKVDE